MKSNLKEKAVNLRKEGLSYSEILRKIPVAKSTLSLWLRNVGLAKRQQQRLTKRKLLAARRGGLARKMQRIQKTKEIQERAIKEIKGVSKRELWLMGIMLYWAEGTKEKEYRPGSNASFANSDPLMIKLFLKWLIEICKISEKRITFSLFIHENHNVRIVEIQRFWARNTKFPLGAFKTVYFKTHKPKTNRHNVGKSYNGVLKITIKASSQLTRKIAGWIAGINKYYCGVV